MRGTRASAPDTQRVVALLRAVNVGGRVLPMASLRGLVEGLGFEGVQTILQIGNVVFDAAATTRRATADLEVRIEEALRSEHALESTVFLRTAAEWEALIAANPFPDEAGSDPAHLVVVLLRETPAASAVDTLQRAIKGRERVRRGERAVYVTYPDGIGRSKLTGAVIEKTLRTVGTARNWNTMLRVAAAVRA